MTSGRLHSEDIATLIDRYDAAWNAQDLDAIASMHDDAIVFHNHTAAERVGQRERQQRGLPRSGWRDQHRGAARPHRVDRGGQHRPNRQVRPGHRRFRQQHAPTLAEARRAPQEPRATAVERC
jgi:Ni/Co efflux regulator RcnB